MVIACYCAPTETAYR